MMRDSFNPGLGHTVGRGLAAILSAASDPGADDIELREVPLELVAPNPRQPRRVFDLEALDGLASSMRDRGVLQPVLVRPAPGGRFELIAGERRWRAAQIAGLATIPALVGVHDDAAALEIALIENVARAELNPVEDAQACAALVEELGLTQEELGRRTGRSRVAVANLLRLLDLPDAVLASIESGALSAGHGRALLTAPGDEVRLRLARETVRDGLSVRRLEERARAAATDSTAPTTRGHASAPPDPEVGRIAHELSELLGGDVRIHRRAQVLRAELRLGSIEDARELASRLRDRTR
ncbi:MAG: parB-like partition protein [Conexibacter sp.]|nr:parB-like partition protein [Conexibacter sp.]